MVAGLLPAAKLSREETSRKQGTGAGAGAGAGGVIASNIAAMLSSDGSTANHFSFPPQPLRRRVHHLGSRRARDWQVAGGRRMLESLGTRRIPREHQPGTGTERLQRVELDLAQPGLLLLPFLPWKLALAAPLALCRRLDRTDQGLRTLASPRSTKATPSREYSHDTSSIAYLRAHDDGIIKHGS
eukprot:768292-Hanusia_phi.AAC.6